MGAQYAPIPERTEEVGKVVVSSALKVHTALGPGLLESAYEACLTHELHRRGMNVTTQVAVPIEYEGLHLTSGLRLDMVVGGLVIVEVKAVEAVPDLYISQLATYFRFTGLRLGFILNFNVGRLKDGLRRVVQ